MTDYVKAWVSNARGAEYGFFKAVEYALEQFGEKNNKPMYALIAFTNGKSFGSYKICLLYTSPSPRDRTRSRMPSSA